MAKEEMITEKKDRRIMISSFLALSLLSIGAIFVKSTGFAIGGSYTNSILGAAAFIFGLISLFLVVRK
jgi:formate/nitrite transporter FocA (FNT family)